MNRTGIEKNEKKMYYETTKGACSVSLTLVLAWAPLRCRCLVSPIGPDVPAHTTRGPPFFLSRVGNGCCRDPYISAILLKSSCQPSLHSLALLKITIDFYILFFFFLLSSCPLVDHPSKELDRYYNYI